jgi:hypothetical protein
VADITFNLWYRLSEELYQRNADYQILVFRPYIERLINALCKQCQVCTPINAGSLEILGAMPEGACFEKGESFSAEVKIGRFCRPLKNCPFEVNNLV